MNTATNIVPVLHPLQCQTKSVHSGDVLLPRWHREGANSPPMQSSLRQQNILLTWCHVVRTRHYQPPHPVLIRYKLMVHTMNELRVLFQRWTGSADDDIIFCLWTKNYSWKLHEGHDGIFDGLGSKIGPKPPPRYHWKANIVKLYFINF